MRGFDEAIAEMPLIAALRGVPEKDALAIGQTLINCGVTVLEVTLRGCTEAMGAADPSALRNLELLKKELGEVAHIMAGTVKAPEDIPLLAQIGITTAVAPNYDPKVLAAAKGQGLVFIPGVETFEQGRAAVQAGADGLKLFPCVVDGEVRQNPDNLMRLIRQLPGVRIYPSGGITPGLAPAYLQVGATAVNAGSELYRSGQSVEDTEAKARAYMTAIAPAKCNPVRVLCIGEPLVESTATRQEDGTLQYVQPTGRFAGDVSINAPSYFVRAAKEIGLPCRVDTLTAFGRVGDKISDAAKNFIRQQGMGIHAYTPHMEGQVSTVINLLNSDGSPAEEKLRTERVQAPYRKLLDIADDKTFGDITRGYDYILVSGIALGCIQERGKFIDLLRIAKRQNPGAKIVVSTNLRPPIWRMPSRETPAGFAADDPKWRDVARLWMDRLVEAADVVFANRTDEAMLRDLSTPDQAVHALQTVNPRAAIILTDDASPIHVAPSRGETYKIDVAPARAVVDTVGAGDSFLGTSLAVMAKGGNLVEAAQYGTYVASQVVGFKGALPPRGQKLQFVPCG